MVVLRLSYMMVLVLCALWSDASAQLRRKDLITVVPLHVVDSLGRSLGEARFLSFNLMAVAIRIPGEPRVLTLAVHSWGFEHFWDTRIGFTTEDCSGQAYFTMPELHLGLLTEEALITTPGSTLWALAIGADEEIVTIRSTLSLACRPAAVVQEMVVAKARPIVDLDTLYSPPFRLELRPK